MKQDKKFLVIKAIPIKGGKNIPVNTSIYRTHGVYYMDGGLLPNDYQKDFDGFDHRSLCDPDPGSRNAV